MGCLKSKPETKPAENSTRQLVESAEVDEAEKKKLQKEKDDAAAKLKDEEEKVRLQKESEEKAEADRKAQEEEKVRLQKEQKEKVEAEARAQKEREEEEDRAFKATIEAKMKKDAEDAQLAASLIPAAPICSGYMSKQGQVFRTWKRRFFVLDHGVLSYYIRETFEGSKTGDQQMGTPLPLKGYSVSRQDNDKLLIAVSGRKFTTVSSDKADDSTSPPLSGRGRAVSSAEAGATGKSRSLLLEVKDPAELALWERALHEHIKWCNITAAPSTAAATVCT